MRVAFGSCGIFDFQNFPDYPGVTVFVSRNTLNSVIRSASIAELEQLLEIYPDLEIV